MRLSAMEIGKRISREMFTRFDEGASFVLVTIERENHYIFDKSGQYGTGRTEALLIIQKYLSVHEAVRIWEEYMKDSWGEMNASTIIRGYILDPLPPLEK